MTILYKYFEPLFLYIFHYPHKNIKCGPFCLIFYQCCSFFLQWRSAQTRFSKPGQSSPAHWKIYSFFASLARPIRKITSHLPAWLADFFNYYSVLKKKMYKNWDDKGECTLRNWIFLLP